jgi:hypothetical protein
MDRKQLVDAIKEAYQKGYRDGFSDACNLMRDATSNLVQSMEEGLEEHTIVVDEQGGEE